MTTRLASHLVVSLLAMTVPGHALLAGEAAPGADRLAAARAAANAGDALGAVLIYDQLLVSAPDDVVLLNESARQLSWAGRHAAAIERYDRVLELDPANRFAAFERAKVLSWAGRYREAIEAFRELIVDDGTDVEARLGLARTLSWSGDQAAARQEYRAILSAQPGHAEATLGLAQTHAWSGEHSEARRLYADAATKLPSPRDAELGLAYLDLWEGNIAGATAASSRLAGLYPGDDEVADLQRAVRRATFPWLAAGWDQMDDTERNVLTAQRYEAGARLPNGVGFGLAYIGYDVRTAGERGSIDSIQARLDWTLPGRHRLDAMVGTDRLEGPAEPGHFVSDWGLSYRFPLSTAWEGWVGGRREPYRYSVPLIDNRIVIDSLFGGVAGRVGEDWRVNAELSGWELSDDNRRTAADLTALRRWARAAHTVEAGGVLRWLDWREDLDNGYFDPSNFVAVGAQARASGPLSRLKSVDYALNLEVGLQSFDYASQRTSGDPYYLMVARVGWQLTPAARLEAFGEAGSYASEGSADWRYSRGGARLVWQFGTGD